MEELRGGADVVLKKIMRQAAAERASDVHIEPGASFVRVRFRKDGLLLSLFLHGAESFGAREGPWAAGCGGEPFAAGWQLGGGDRWGAV